MSPATPEEVRTITLSRMLDDHRVVFAGVGAPLVASALERRLEPQVDKLHGLLRVQHSPADTAFREGSHCRQQKSDRYHPYAAHPS